MGQLVDAKKNRFVKAWYFHYQCTLKYHSHIVRLFDV